MPVKGIITINGVKYPIQDFTINWTNPTEPYWLNGDPYIRFYNPYAETEEQKDQRLNPRKYDSCKFCDHYRHRHELGYQKCTGINSDWDGEEHECECEGFV